MDHSLTILIGTILAVVVFTPLIVSSFLRDVDAGEIRLVSWLNGNLKIYRGPCKAAVIPILTVTRVIPAQAINVDIEITDQTADLDANNVPAPVKVTVRASAIVSVGEDDAMVNTAANKFFSKPAAEQLNTLTDVLSSAGRRAINLLRHDQLFNSRAVASTAVATRPAGAVERADMVDQGEDDELAVIIKDACSRELLDLGLSFNSLNIKAVLSEVADARRREAAARAKASADVVQAQEEQRARIAQLEAEEKINDQERALKMQIAANGAAIARAEAERQAVVREQRQAELSATQITQAQADADQNVIAFEAEGRAEAARIRAVAEAEAEAIREKAEALREAGELYLALRRIELAPELTQQVADALSGGQFINFGGGSGPGSAVSNGSDDILRVVQTLVAAQVLTGGNPVPMTAPAAFAATTEPPAAPKRESPVTPPPVDDKTPPSR